MTERKAVYPGTFDPVTVGHMDVIATAASMFDEVMVLVFPRPEKHPMFNVQARIDMVKIAVRAHGLTNVSVDIGAGLVVRQAEKLGASWIVKGLRMVQDYEYELQQSMLNSALSHVTTVYIPSKQEHIHVSSSAVRELLRNNESSVFLVPGRVRTYIEERGEKAYTGYDGG